MPRQMTRKTEAEIRQELIQSQELYTQSLACLDELALDSSFELESVEEAAGLRRSSYARYRQAMDEL